MKKNLTSEFEKIKEFWSPSIIAQVNNSYVKLAKLKGNLVWHTHEEEDELFLIIKGTMTMQYKDKKVTLKEGDCHVVPKGEAHFPETKEECWVLLVEDKSTMHTGEVVGDFTKSIENQLNEKITL
jgi:mannose-6-phosphate isomerase-like protein (cupin superfamily)